MRRGVLLGGLTAGALLVSGCGQELGSTVAAGKGECVPAESTYDLAPGNRVFASGDIEYGGQNSDEGISDRLQILNAGRGVLKLNADDGGIKYGDISVNAPDMNAVTTADIKVGGEHSSFGYEQGGAQFAFSSTMRAGGHVALKVSVSCPAK